MPVQRICAMTLTDLREVAEQLSAAWPLMPGLASDADATLTFAGGSSF